jgi:hypothetical protein
MHIQLIELFNFDFIFLNVSTIYQYIFQFIFSFIFTVIHNLLNILIEI